MTNADAPAVALVERLLEPNETMANWSQWYGDIEWLGLFEARRYIHGSSRASNPRSLVLTQSRLLSVTFTSRLFGAAPRIETFWARPLPTFFAWRFTKIVDERGAPRHYSFRVAARDGLPTGTLFAYPREAEPLVEELTAASARFKALSGSANVASQLSAMHSLWSEGALSDAEYRRAKELFLGRPPDAEEQAARSLRNLKQLLDSGVLTESEFRSKKWQILSA